MTTTRPPPAYRPPSSRPSWLSLGLAAVIGLAAGATLFPTKAHGRGGDRPPPRAD